MPGARTEPTCRRGYLASQIFTSGLVNASVRQRHLAPLIIGEVHS